MGPQVLGPLQHTYSLSPSLKHTSNCTRNLARHPHRHNSLRPSRRPRRPRQRPHHPILARSASIHSRPLPTSRQERQRDHPRPAPLAWREAEPSGRAEDYACDEYVTPSHDKVWCGLMRVAQFISRPGSGMRWLLKFRRSLRRGLMSRKRGWGFRRGGWGRRGF